MRSLLLVLVLAFVTGCATKDVVKETVYTAKSDFASIPVITVGEPATPIEIRDYPDATVVVTDTGQYGCFTEDGFRTVLALRIANEANAEALRRTNETLRLRVENRNDLLSLGQKVEQESNHLREIGVEKEKQLKALEIKHTAQLWKERIIAGVVVVLALLAK